MFDEGGTRSTAQFGDVYTVTSPDDGVGAHRAVVVLIPDDAGGELGEPQLVVAPISTQLEFATREDLLVPQHASPLGYPFFVEAWHAVGVLKASLGERLGTLGAAHCEALAEILTYLQDDALSAGLGVHGSTVHGSLQTAGSVAAFRDREFETFRHLNRPLMEAVGRHEALADPDAPPDVPPLDVLVDTLRVADPVVQESVRKALETASRGAEGFRIVRYLVSGVQSAAGQTRMFLARALSDVVRGARRLLAEATEPIALSGFEPVGAPAGTFAGEERRRFRLVAGPSDGRLTVTAWETDAGMLQVDVQTPEPTDAGRVVRVVLLGEDEPLVREVPLAAHEFEGRFYGCTGQWEVGRFATVAARLGAACAVAAVFADEAG